MTKKAPLLEAIDIAMQPLTQRFGLRVVGESDSPSWSEIDYANETTGVKVALDWSEFRPFVSVCEMTGGKFPPEATSAATAQHAKSFDVDDLLLIRATDESPVGKMLGTRSAQGVERLLRQYARALDLHAADVLSGDFTVFSELARIVRARFDSAAAKPHATAPTVDLT